MIEHILLYMVHRFALVHRNFMFFGVNSGDLKCSYLPRFEL